MPTAFRKMHGAGNDFMVLDARAEPLSLTTLAVRALADRRLGVGWDQLVVIEAASQPEADAAMRIYNPDGSEAGACGNATRCVARLLSQESGRPDVTVQTRGGLLPAVCLDHGEVRVDMGPPRLLWHEVPLRGACDTLWLDLPGSPAAVSMGNPHATVFVPVLDAVDPALAGPALETHPMFPDRANIGFAQVLAPDRIRLRVWERGAGLTLACGSGACAALVNAHRRGLAGRRAALVLDGGTLLIEWRPPDPPAHVGRAVDQPVHVGRAADQPPHDGQDGHAADGCLPQEQGHVWMTGPAVTAFHGTVDLTTYGA